MTEQETNGQVEATAAPEEVQLAEPQEPTVETLEGEAPESAPAKRGADDALLERFEKHVQAAASGILHAGWDGIDYIRARYSLSDSALREACVKNLTNAAQAAYDDRIVSIATVDHWLRYSATVELFAGKRKMPVFKAKKKKGRTLPYRMAVEFAVVVERVEGEREERYQLKAEYAERAVALWTEMVEKGLTAEECAAALRTIMGKEPKAAAAPVVSAPTVQTVATEKAPVVEGTPAAAPVPIIPVGTPQNDPAGNTLSGWTDVILGTDTAPQGPQNVTPATLGPCQAENPMKAIRDALRGIKGAAAAREMGRDLACLADTVPAEYLGEFIGAVLATLAGHADVTEGVALALNEAAEKVAAPTLVQELRVAANDAIVDPEREREMRRAEKAALKAETVDAVPVAEPVAA